MASTIFVTGTDTGVGKTHAACALIHALRAQGRSVCGYKPVASGCEASPQGWRNADALALAAASASREAYDTINPYAFEPAIAPHLAAARAGIAIDTAVLDAAHDALASRHERIVVEGAGGWLVPLDAERSVADWVAARGWPVVLVVGLRLGCINHALLSAEAIARRTRFAGWIANRLPPAQAEWQENLDTLQRRLGAPLLGCLPQGLAPESAAGLLSLPGL
ncbi:MAG: dethiobiotin synthase [Nevskia sp.]